jgi:hypothetical protein
MNSLKHMVYLPKICCIEFVNIAEHKLDFFIDVRRQHGSQRMLKIKFDSSVFFKEIIGNFIFIDCFHGLDNSTKVLNTIKQYFFYFRNFIWRIFKAHGINMRLINRRISQRFFLRVGFGHGFYLPQTSVFSVKIYRKRYFMVGGFEKRFFEFFSYHLRYLRRFFRYKLIGVKSKRDIFKIKVGKKKTF